MSETERLHMTRGSRRTFQENEALASWRGGGKAECGHLCRSSTELAVHQWLGDVPHTGEQMLPGQNRWCDMVLAGRMVEFTGAGAMWRVLEKYQGTGIHPLVVRNKEWNLYQSHGLLTPAIEILMTLKLSAQTTAILPTG
jgi:hypothetical protein